MEISTKLFVGSLRYTERRYLIGREEAHPPLAPSPRSRTPAREIPEDRFERARLRAVSGIGPLNALIPPSPLPPWWLQREKDLFFLSLSLPIHFSSPKCPLFRSGKTSPSLEFFFPNPDPPSLPFSRPARDRQFIIWPGFGRRQLARETPNASPRSTGLPDKSKG